MADAVEHGRFDGRVVDHVLENDRIADAERLLERPVAHEVAAQAAAAADAVRGAPLDRLRGAADSGFVGHFEAVGHVAGEGGVDDGRGDAAVLDDVHDGRLQVARLPEEGRSGLEDEREVRVGGAETAEGVDEQVDVVAGARHQVAAAHVQPTHLWQPAPEALLDGAERLHEVLGRRFAEGVEVQPLDARGQSVGQLVGGDAHARSGGAGVVERRAYLGIFGVDAQAAGDPCAVGFDHRAEARVLGEGVEGDVAAAAEQLGEVGLGVGRRIGVGGGAHLVEDEAGLPDGAGRGAWDVFADDGEDVPQGGGFQGEDDLYAGALLDLTDKREVAAEQGFFNDVAGGFVEGRG